MDGKNKKKKFCLVFLFHLSYLFLKKETQFMGFHVDGAKIEAIFQDNK